MTTSPAVTSPALPPTAHNSLPAARGPLPAVASVLAVTARPGQEASDLGGLLYAFRRAGADLSLLCLTRGEASPLNSSQHARLEAIRPWELQLASGVLGVSSVAVANYPDGALHRQPVAELTSRIARAISEHRADLLLVLDPRSGDPGDGMVAIAACAAARRAGVPVVARTTSAAPGAWLVDLGDGTATARAIQKAAAGAHVSQSEDLPNLVRRLDLLGRHEPLRWLARQSEPALWLTRRRRSSRPAPPAPDPA